MRKLGAFATMMVSVTLLLGASAAASSPYPPGGPSLTLTPSTVAPGGSFTATLTGCTTGETVNFTLAGATIAATCTAGGVGAPSTATARVTAPRAAGTYTVTATGVTSGVTASATLTVRAPAAGGGALPTTGSDSDRTLWIAGSAIVAGLGLVAVAWQRRRSTTTA